MQSEVYNEKNSKFDSYRYYVVGLKIDGVYYTAKLAVGQKSGESYYDHALTEIEKSNLLNLTNGVKADVSDKEATLSSIKDKRLISVLQTNSSKVVDENGEPQVVCHGSDAAFTEFKPSEDGALGKGMYFSESREYAKGVRPNATVYDTYLNIRNPYMAQSPGVPPIEDLRKKGYDGIFATGPHFGVMWEASQTKSVTENTGAFSAESDDVRYRVAEADYASVQEDAAMEYESALDTPMDISVADMMPIEAAENAQAAGLLRDVVKRFPDTKIAITDLSRVYAAAEVAEIDGDGVRYRVKSGIDTKSAPETELPEAETSFKGTAISSADGAKILNNWGNLTKDYENISSVKERTFSGSLTMPDTTTVSA